MDTADMAVVAAAATESAPEPALHPTHAAIDAWFASHFHNSVVSRDTEIFNLVHAAVQDLKRRLIKEH